MAQQIPGFVFLKVFWDRFPKEKREPTSTGEKKSLEFHVYHLERIDGDRHSHERLGLSWPPKTNHHRTWEWRSRHRSFHYGVTLVHLEDDEIIEGVKRLMHFKRRLNGDVFFLHVEIYGMKRFEICA